MPAPPLSSYYLGFSSIRVSCLIYPPLPLLHEKLGSSLSGISLTQLETSLYISMIGMLTPPRGAVISTSMPGRAPLEDSLFTRETVQFHQKMVKLEGS